VRTAQGLLVFAAPDRIVRFSLLAMALSIAAAHAVFARYAPELQFKIGWANGLWKTWVTLAALAAPYFFGGLIVAAILSDSTRKITRLYALNLVGSALGCTVIFFALRPLGAPVLLAVLAALTALLAVPLFRTSYGMAGTVIFALALGFCSVYWQAELFEFPPQPGGQLRLIEEAANNPSNLVKGRILRDANPRWDPMGCVEVTEYEPESRDAMAGALDSMWFTQDSSYGSPLVGVGANGRAADPFFFRTVYGAGYFRGHPDAEVLVIGLGGAPDVQAALRNGAQRIVGVDINQSTIDMVREEKYAEFLGDPYGDPAFLSARVERGAATPEVELVRMDGRSYVQGAVEPFDLIQLTGVDTKFVLASGNLAVHENYLYTREAFEDYLRCLKPGGMLSVVYGGLDYLVRLTETARAALAQMRREGVEGIGEPRQHMLLLRQGPVIVNLLVKRTPFRAEECRALLEWVRGACEFGPDGAPRTGVILLPYEALKLSVNEPVEIVYCPDAAVMADPLVERLRELRPGEEASAELRRQREADRRRERRFAEAVGDATLADWVMSQTLDLSAVGDDRPFFFHTYGRNTTLASMHHHLAAKLEQKLCKLGLEVDIPGADQAPVPSLGRDHPFQRQVIVIFLMLLLAAVLTFAPLLWFRIRGNRIGGSIPWAIYFAALGLGFILAEVGLIQRYVLFLGTQSYAFAVVIGGLLVAAGLGSLCAGRFLGAPLRVIGNCVLAIVLVLLLQHLFLAQIFETAGEQPLAWRLLIGFAALLPLGFPMGFLFPTALYRIRTRGESFVPWGIGLNGVFSVLGSTVAVPLSILFGFTAVTAIAGGTYLLALWMALLTRD
jgi:SAM-dependent methyltransferase